MLGEKIISERKEHYLSQEALAQMVGVTRQTISNWELNETGPDLKQASKLADIFGISIDELIGKKNILLEKIDKTESNSKLIIKLIKVLTSYSCYILFYSSSFKTPLITRPIP